MATLERSRHLAAVVSATLVLGLLPTQGTFAKSSTLDQALARLEDGQVAEAHRIAEAALARNPRNPEAHLVLGQVLLDEGQSDKAAKSFEFALALDPKAQSRVAEAYLAAMRRALAQGSSDRAETYLAKAGAFDAGLRDAGIKLLFDDALARVQANDPKGAQLLERWLSRFPDFTPTSEQGLFTLAHYYEASGSLDEAARYYRKCAEDFPDGTLGHRAAERLASRRVRVHQLLSADCPAGSGRLFVQLRDLELSYGATKAEVSLIWSTAGRSGDPGPTLTILSSSQIQVAGGAAVGMNDRGVRVALSNDAERRATLTFPPVNPAANHLSLSIAENLCGEGAYRGHHAFRFKDISLDASQNVQLNPVRAVPVFHIHEYFVATGSCSGTLRFEPDRISFVSDEHSVDLPCADIVRIARGSKELSTDIFGRLGETKTVPTLLIKARITTKRGKQKVKTWQFLAQDGTPPVLLLSDNLCPTGR